MLRIFILALLFSPLFAHAQPNTAIAEQRIAEAAAAFEGQDFAQAAQLFREIVALEPQNALAWHFLGQSLAKLGDKEGAKQAYERVLEIQPTGQVADRTRQFMVELSLPELPASVSTVIADAYKKFPLFAQLPTGRAYEVRSETRTKHADGRQSHYQFHTVYEPLGGGVIQSTGTTTGEVREGKKTEKISQAHNTLRLAGVNLTLKYLDKWEITEVTEASGQIYPFRVGGGYILEHKYRMNAGGSEFLTNQREVCSITESIPGNTVHPVLPAEAYVMECTAQSKSLTSDFESVREYTEICSNELGDCYFHLETKTGQVPDFSKGYVETGADGSTITHLPIEIVLK